MSGTNEESAYGATSHSATFGHGCHTSGLDHWHGLDVEIYCLKYHRYFYTYCEALKPPWLR